MKTSPNGAAMMTGAGVKQVRKKIQEEFGKALSVDEAQQQAITAELDGAAPPKPLRDLADVAVPILKVAERKFRDVVVGHARPVYHIACPTETAEQLIAEAMKVVKSTPKKEERQIVEGE